MHIFKDTHYDFLRWRWHAIILSWVIIIAGVATLATKGIPRGVEFATGTSRAAGSTWSCRPSARRRRTR
jgi:preprotein translocase subunit SecF